MDSSIENDFYIESDELEEIGNEHCNGCMLCVHLCPQKAIDIIKGEMGFLYPLIDKNKCVNCKKCLIHCPIHRTNNNPLLSKYCYAVQTEDEIRFISSSGGMFYAIAKSFIKNGGFVSGAVWDDKIVKHKVINNIEDLHALCKSKYIQSRADDAYGRIKELLNMGEKVLFVGTPCQCDAVYDYCNGHIKLYLIDLLCMGVPSQHMFIKYLKENFEKKINKIDFRYKENNRWESTLLLSLSFDDGEKKIIENNDSSFYKAFLSGISLRKSCTECTYAGKKRIGDITIGDFWGIKTYDFQLDDGFGTSLVLVNSKKGRELFNSCKSLVKLQREIPIEEAFSRNPILKFPVGESYARRKMADSYNESKSINEMVRQILDEKADCGIFNYWCSDDNGAILTAYALQVSLEKIGYSSLLVDVGFERKGDGISKKFESKYLKTTLPIYEDSLSSLNNRFSNFIVGSDQVFRREWVPDSFYLDFVNEEKRKIAISASFGKDQIDCSKSQKREIRYWLKRFSALSSREDVGVHIFKSLGCKGCQIIDPVFWLNRNEYIKNLGLDSTQKNEKNLVVYFRDESEKKRQMVDTIRRILDANVILLDDNTEVEKFLESISNARLLITDSYHGVCYAIIFNVEYFCTMNEQRGNSRFESLIRLLKLEKSHFISEECIITEQKINELQSDWNKINQTIIHEKKKALLWTQKSLQKNNMFYSSFKAKVYKFKNEIMDFVGNRIYYIYKYFFRMIDNEKFVCYGAGYYGKKAAEKFGEKIVFFIDMNPNIIWHEGKYVYTLERASRILNKNTKIVLTVGNEKRNEIRNLLSDYGYINILEMENL